jgi:hypothetical protein
MGLLQQATEADHFHQSKQYSRRQTADAAAVPATQLLLTWQHLNFTAHAQ